jgi:hypothetical protein
MKSSFHTNQILYVKDIGYARVPTDTNKQVQPIASKITENQPLNNQNNPNENTQILPKLVSQHQN